MSVTTGRTENELPWTPVYQEYCPLLFEAINEGDKVAARFLQWLCGALAGYVITGAKKLNMQDREITMVVSGGVAKSGAILGEFLQQRLKEDLSGIKCVDARFEPVVGALLIEYDRLYPEGIPKEVTSCIEQSCTKKKLFREFSKAAV